MAAKQRCGSTSHKQIVQHKMYDTPPTDYKGAVEQICQLPVEKRKALVKEVLAILAKTALAAYQKEGDLFAALQAGSQEVKGDVTTAMWAAFQ